MKKEFESYDHIVQQIAHLQPRLFAFVRTLIADSDQARNILQEVNLVLWQKRDEFESIKNYSSWACGVARYQVMAFLRDRSRDKHFFYDEQLLSKVADHAAKLSNEEDQRTQALRICLSKLTGEQRQLIQSRYTNQESVKSIAKTIGKTPGAIAKILFLARRALSECITKKMQAEHDI